MKFLGLNELLEQIVRFFNASYIETIPEYSARKSMILFVHWRDPDFRKFIGRAVFDGIEWVLEPRVDKIY